MLLPEFEADVPRLDRLARPLDIPRGDIRSTEVDPDLGLQVPFQPAQIPPGRNLIPHGGEQALEVRASEVGAGFEFRQGVDGGADGVEGDVEGGVDVEFLGEVGVDAQELVVVFFAAVRGGLGGLRFEAGEEGLEPFEG